MGIRVTRENLVPLFDLSLFFIFGCVAFLAGPLFLLRSFDHLFIGNYAYPSLLAAAHTLLLGWGTAIALGALQQLIPVLFSTTLYSERLARWAAVLYVVGVSSLILGFWRLGPLPFIVGVSCVFVAIGMVGVNVWRSQRGTLTQSARVTQPYVRSAYTYLALTVLAGIVLAINMFTGTLRHVHHILLPAHMTFGLVGWFTMLILGISYHMLPFFGLTPKKRSFSADKYVRYVLHGGIAIVWIASWHAALGPLFSIGLFIIGCALLLFLWDTRFLFAKPRRKRKLNPTVAHVRLGHAYLGVLAVVLFICLFRAPTNQMAVLIGFLGLYGWLSNTILGYFYRILPFYIWHNKYWGRGREPGVPAFRNMVAIKPAWIGGVVYNMGIIGVLLAYSHAELMYVALICVAAGAFICGGNLLRTVFR